jgi:K+-sensing histidine kinase KdpD
MSVREARAAGSVLVPAGRHAWLAAAAGLLAPLAAAAALTTVRLHVANAALSLVLAGVVVAVAAFGDRRAGILASVSAGVWFDFFLTRPYERFSISSSRDLETTLALLAVGVAVTEIAERSRRYYSVASREGDYLARIHDLSDLVATGAPAGLVIELAERDLRELLSLAACRFEAREPSPERARLDRNGEVERRGWRYDVARDGLPADGLELVVAHLGREVGVFEMTPSRPVPLAIEPRIVALAIADQVGAALADPAQLDRR